MAAINSVLDLYEVGDKRTMFDTIITCFNVINNIEAEKDKKEESD